GYALAALIQQVVTHQYQGQAGGADVLLRAGVDQAKAGDIQGLGQNVGGGVAHQRDVDLGDVVILQPADGFVGGVVQVSGIGGERNLRLARHPGVAVGFAAACRVDGETELFGLCTCFLGPDTGVQEVGAAALPQQVQRDHRELHGGAALQKQHLVVFGDAKQLAQVGLGLPGNG